MHRVLCHEAQRALRLDERGRAVNQWAFPRIAPQMVNDMRINYAQGSRQAELATVDGAEKRGKGGGGNLWAAQSASPGDRFIILFERGCIYCKAREASRGEIWNK